MQRAYADCAEHYHFLIDPCLPRTPQHKGKVEWGGLDELVLPVSSSTSDELFGFARSADELAEALGGGVTWN